MLTHAINLTFHGIGSPQVPLEAGEEQVWTSQEIFESVLESARDEPRVRITFDDGNRSDFDIALPALVERGLTADIFVVAGKIGEAGYLSQEQIRELARAGMRIGSHGMEHRSWRQLDAAALEREVGSARSRIEDVIGGPVVAAACPFGAYDGRVLRCLREHGYEAVFSSDGGLARRDAWFQPRTTIRADEDGRTVARLRVARPHLPSELLRRLKIAIKSRR